MQCFVLHILLRFGSPRVCLCWSYNCWSPYRHRWAHRCLNFSKWPRVRGFAGLHIVSKNFVTHHFVHRLVKKLTHSQSWVEVVVVWETHFGAKIVDYLYGCTKCWIMTDVNLNFRVYFIPNIISLSLQKTYDYIIIVQCGSVTIIQQCTIQWVCYCYWTFLYESDFKIKARLNTPKKLVVYDRNKIKNLLGPIYWSSDPGDDCIILCKCCSKLVLQCIGPAESSVLMLQCVDAAAH